MKKKTFLQNSWFFYLMFSIEVLLEVGCIWSLLDNIFCDEPTTLFIPEWLQNIMFSGGIFLWLYQMIIFGRDRIVLEPSKINIPDSRKGTKVKIQYKVEVNYADIEGVFIAETQKDSLNLNDCSAIPIDVLYLYL